MERVEKRVWRVGRELGEDLLFVREVGRSSPVSQRTRTGTRHSSPGSDALFPLTRTHGFGFRLRL